MNAVMYNCTHTNGYTFTYTITMRSFCIWNPNDIDERDNVNQNNIQAKEIQQRCGKWNKWNRNWNEYAEGNKKMRRAIAITITQLASYCLYRAIRSVCLSASLFLSVTGVIVVAFTTNAHDLIYYFHHSLKSTNNCLCWIVVTYSRWTLPIIWTNMEKMCARRCKNEQSTGFFFSFFTFAFILKQYHLGLGASDFTGKANLMLQKVINKVLIIQFLNLNICILFEWCTAKKPSDMVNDSVCHGNLFSFWSIVLAFKIKIISLIRAGRKSTNQ